MKPIRILVGILKSLKEFDIDIDAPWRSSGIAA